MSKILVPARGGAADVAQIEKIDFTTDKALTPKLFLEVPLVGVEVVNSQKAVGLHNYKPEATYDRVTIDSPKRYEIIAIDTTHHIRLTFYRCPTRPTVEFQDIEANEFVRDDFYRFLYLQYQDGTDPTISPFMAKDIYDNRWELWALSRSEFSMKPKPGAYSAYINFINFNLMPVTSIVIRPRNVVPDLSGGKQIYHLETPITVHNLTWPGDPEDWKEYLAPPPTWNDGLVAISDDFYFKIAMTPHTATDPDREKFRLEKGVPIGKTRMLVKRVDEYSRWDAMNYREYTINNIESKYNEFVRENAERVSLTFYIRRLP
jgi:hypothetical protein